MDALGDFLTGLPVPLGPIVTGLLPVATIGGFIVALWGYAKGRRAIAFGALAVGVVGLIGMVAFISAT